MTTNNNYVADDDVFKNLTAVSVEEILAAGGATAFGNMTGKNTTALKEALRNAPKPEPFTKEQWDDLVTIIENDK